MGLFGFFKKGSGSNDSVDPELAGRIETWIQDLGDDAWEIRLKACEALGELGTKGRAATPRLQDLIDDDHGDVCLAAAAALSNIERGL